MSLTNTTCRETYTGNGATTAFATGFFFLSNSVVSVVLTDLSGNATTLNQGTDYTVSGAANPSGGTVTLAIAPASGYGVAVLRMTPLVQNTTFEPNDALPASSLENGLDLLTMQQQELSSTGGSVDRSIKYGPTEPTGYVSQLPAAAARANLFLGFDANGALALLTDTSGAAASAAAAAASATASSVSAAASATQAGYASASATAAAASAATAATYPIPLWVTGYAYIVNNTVLYANQIYDCLVAHTSGTFATDLAANKWVLVSGISTLTGDVTTSGTTATIPPNTITNAKAAQMAANTIKGNNTGSTANASDLTAAQAAAILPAVVGDSGAGGAKGLVPAPGAGDAAAGKFLKADGTWAVSSVVGLRASVDFLGVPVTGLAYSRTGTLLTVTQTAHGYTVGMLAETASATDPGNQGIGNPIQSVTANTWSIGTAGTGATTGTLTLRSLIRKQTNVASILSNGAGDFTITFTAALADANYVVTANAVGGVFPIVYVASSTTSSPATLKSTTQVRVNSSPANSASLTNFYEYGVNIV